MVERQAALGAPVANVACQTQSTTVELGVVGDIELVICRVFLETLLATPSHVLEREKRSIRGEQEIQVANTNEHVVNRVNYVTENPVLRWAKRSIGNIGIVFGATEDVAARTLLPVGAHGCIYGFLHVCTVEVDLRTRGVIVTRIDYAQLRI